MSDYYDLGNYSMPVSTRVPAAQAWFDRGYLWCIGFNHDEAIACFRQALEHDPNCAMAWWGIAYAAGPNYNKPWAAFDEVDLARCFAETAKAIATARTLAHDATALERDLIEAQAARSVAAAIDALPALNDAYAAAMADVFARHPDNPDVCALYAEAMMIRTAWLLWDLKSGQPGENADTLRIVAILEAALAANAAAGAAPHPGLLHYYIHTMEMSPAPEKALAASNQLRGLAPDSGHLQHMPTHIDVLCGDYQSVIDWNEAAIIADRSYLEREGAANFYSFYRCHNYHFKAYGAMFLGQYQPAIAAAREMVATLPEALMRVTSPPMADWLEAFVPTDMHVYIRFGKWREIIDAALPADQLLYAFTTATMHYAKAVAHAASGDVLAAQAAAARFEAAALTVPATRKLMNNFCADLLAIARAMMQGEIAYRLGDYATAFAHLRRSVELDDTLPYDEPWGWMQPTRHALGALLLEQGQLQEAAAVYRADLGLDATLSRACQHPNNVWSLHGYHECLRKLGRIAEASAIKQRLDVANALTDVPVKASCFCKQPAA